MGPQVYGVIDQNIIRIQYSYESIDDIAPVDIMFNLIHKYTSTAGAQQIITLSTFMVPAEQFITVGTPGISVTQYVDVTYVNPRYVNSLFVQTSAIRNSVPELLESSILVGTAEEDYHDGTAAPSNPEKSVHFSENIPNIQPESPSQNVITQAEPINPLIYELKNVKALTARPYSVKILLSNSDETQKFVQSGTVSIPLLVENGVSNIAPNPAFAVSGSNIPTGYYVYAPGFIVTNSIKPGDVANTNKWIIAASNPNWASAFNTLKISSGQVYLPTGIQTVSASIYLKAHRQSTNPFPFSDIYMSMSMFDSMGNLITSNSVESPSPTDSNWERLKGTFQVPGGAAYCVW